MNSKKRNIGIIYDTLEDMKDDPDLKSGMVVTTLGKNKINDSYGETYKIVANSSNNSFSSERIDFNNNDYAHAEPIGSSNYEDRIKLIQSAIQTSNQNIDKNFNSISDINNNLLMMKICAPSETIMDAYSTCGVKIGVMVNGQKFVIVTDIPPEEEIVEEPVETLSLENDNVEVASENETESTISTEEEEISVLEDEPTESPVVLPEEEVVPLTFSLSGNIATIVVPAATYNWILPATLSLVNFVSTTLYVNDNCTLVYDPTDNTITFTVNRQLCPAVYYYM